MNIWSINLQQQESQEYTMGKNSLLNKWSWKNCTSISKRIKPDHYPTPYIKINLKWIKHLNIRLKIIKLLEENKYTKAKSYVHPYVH